MWRKLRDNQFYPAWAHVIATALVSLPHMAIDALIWSALTYWMVGFYPRCGETVGRVTCVDGVCEDSGN